ncbi:DEAD/DEAH box helicase [Vibrio sp. 10N.247.311.12]|uniref:DEAD/DEAH box helicase n=1 Tax=unclassified Vibrio TaxID=2614977 RepID=UPI00354FBC5F
MYDPETANLLRSAPALDGIDPVTIPQLLTSHYAKIVSARLGGESDQEESGSWSLEKIADTYETIASIHSVREIKKSSAFVAASAQQVISRKELLESERPPVESNVDIARVSPSLAAVLLFLAAEQYADAHEAASNIRIDITKQEYCSYIISQHVIDLGRGDLTKIVERANVWRQQFPPGSISNDVEAIAIRAMMNHLAFGIEELAKLLLEPNFQQREMPRVTFNRVLDLAAERKIIFGEERIDYTYPGIRHLASLLLLMFDGISGSALANVPPPIGADPTFWNNWISYRAKKFPYIWHNHRKALDRFFHFSGVSSVLVLPTGAGKTTVSSIKIASVLAQGKKVVFLAPTHALVDQLTNDLSEMFPSELLGSSVSSDFDLLLKMDIALPEIEVMTPERCLAIISFSPDSFEDVGLLVFDECHLLSPEAGKIRRALDGMLCVLGFNEIAPQADMLFLSAMIKNGDEFAKWIEELTGRQCLNIELLWKPSRQARGVVIYNNEELEQVKRNAIGIQNKQNLEKGKVAKALRSPSKKELNVQPHVLWGLQHNWLDTKNNKAICNFTKLIDENVFLNGVLRNGKVALQPNANSVAAQIATICAKRNMKTIVFVNQKQHACSLASEISHKFSAQIDITEKEQKLWNALAIETGGLEHSILHKPTVAVPHNASMLKLERELAESMYRRDNGARVIVATPTLAQGLNLPAQMAVLAGDKRASADGGGRESLASHELLNAAARAGRAGHLANGIVLLIPDPVISFSSGSSLTPIVVEKLQSLIPEDDRCVVITDPLTEILDRISVGDVLDRDVLYMVNRVASLDDNESSNESSLKLRRSFAAYKAKQSNNFEEFNLKINTLLNLTDSKGREESDIALSALASQSGLPIDTILLLKSRVESEPQHLPISVDGWVRWLVQWLKENQQVRALLLDDVKRSMLGAVGKSKDAEILDEDLDTICEGISSWIKGKPIRDIEVSLGGEPYATAITKQQCPQARELISNVIPRSFSFIMGLITRVVVEVAPFSVNPLLNTEMIESLSTAVRLGYDSVEKLNFALANPHLLSRVVVHLEFDKMKV